MNDLTFAESHLIPTGMGPQPKLDTAIFTDNFNIRVSYRTEREALMPLLPPGMEPAGEPTISFTYRHSEKVEWVVSTEFNSCGMCIPAVWKGKDGEEVNGSYFPAVWENDAMAVILGREIFGVGKLVADITNPMRDGDGWKVLLSEGGLPLIEIRIQDLKPLDDAAMRVVRERVKNSTVLGWKQFPTNDLKGMELGFATRFFNPGKVREAWSCDGEVTVFEPDPIVHVWTQSIVKTLRGLPRLECLGANLVCGSSEMHLHSSKILK